MVSLRLTGEAQAILARLAKTQGVSQVAVLELLLRTAARQDQSNDVPPRRTEHSPSDT